VILIDEIEAHLHPQWQRLILPAVSSLQEELNPAPQIQYLIATHSPLVLASLEPLFNEKLDKLFHLDLRKEDPIESRVLLSEMPFIRYGPVDSWLMSDIFDLGSARSVEAERAITDGKALQLKEHPSPEEIRKVSDRLIKYLAAEDGFWPRWTYFAEQHGVHI
jgi:hypothetical protein